MSDDHNRDERRREELDAITEEVRQFASPPELRRLLRKAGTPEDVEALIKELIDMREARRGRGRVWRDIIYITVTTSALIAALAAIRAFYWTALSWLMTPPS